MKSPHSPQVSSFAAAEATRRVHEDCIREIQTLPAFGLRVIKDVQLASGIATPIAHKLGRAPSFVRESCLRGAVSAGYILEDRSGTNNRAEVIVLTASGFGGTVTVDVLVV